MKIITRAHGRRAAVEIYRSNADFVIRDIFGSSLLAGEKALIMLGVDAVKAHKTIEIFKEYDEKFLIETVKAPKHKDGGLLSIGPQYRSDLDRVLQEDEEEKTKQDKNNLIR